MRVALTGNTYPLGLAAATETLPRPVSYPWVRVQLGRVHRPVRFHSQQTPGFERQDDASDPLEFPEAIRAL